jgi:hypothetical protein
MVKVVHKILLANFVAEKYWAESTSESQLHYKLLQSEQEQH